MAGGGRVDAVGQVKVGHAADALQQKRDEGDLVYLRQLGIHGGELTGVFWPHIRGHLHARQNNFNGRIAPADTLDHGLEVGAGSCRVYSAQSVVAPQFDAKNIHGLPQDPVQPAQATRGGLAAQPGVNDAPGEAAGIQFMLDQRRECFVGIETIAGGQAVAEKEQGLRLRCTQPRDQPQAENERPPRLVFALCRKFTLVQVHLKKS